MPDIDDEDALNLIVEEADEFVVISDAADNPIPPSPSRGVQGRLPGSFSRRKRLPLIPAAMPSPPGSVYLLSMTALSGPSRRILGRKYSVSSSSRIA